MTEISYLEYENIPKGKIASINYKEEKRRLKKKHVVGKDQD